MYERNDGMVNRCKRYIFLQFNPIIYKKEMLENESNFDNRGNNKLYTLTLKGHIGHSMFYADLEGACLNIKSSHPLTNRQVSKLEGNLQKTFQVPFDGKFKEDEIDEIMENSPLIFRV